ncbi:hypothetical protein JCM8097_003836 [Rhodosporidiobolus ruineniae]
MASDSAASAPAAHLPSQELEPGIGDHLSALTMSMSAMEARQDRVVHDLDDLRAQVRDVASAVYLKRDREPHIYSGVVDAVLEPVKDFEGQALPNGLALASWTKIKHLDYATLELACKHYGLAGYPSEEEATRPVAARHGGTVAHRMWGGVSAWLIGEENPFEQR